MSEYGISDERLEKLRAVHRKYKACANASDLILAIEERLTAANAIIEKLITAYRGWESAVIDFRDYHAGTISDCGQLLEIEYRIESSRTEMITVAREAAQETP